MSVSLQQLLDTTRQWLNPDAFKDYCPNGLQVEGKSEVAKIVTGVTASMALIEQAEAAGADAILVHHGYFWRGEPEPVVGMKRARLKRLLAADMSLIAYHLPLDAQPEFGNNVRLGQLLEFTVESGLEPDNPKGIGLAGRLPRPMYLAELADWVGDKLARPPVRVGYEGKLLHTVAWCTGAAQGYIEKAVQLGVDVYLSGEISEPTFHIAQETGVSYLAAGHHATERYGIQALGDRLSATFGIEHEFIDIDNPV